MLVVTNSQFGCKDPPRFRLINIPKATIGLHYSPVVLSVIAPIILDSVTNDIAGFGKYLYLAAFIRAEIGAEDKLRPPTNLPGDNLGNPRSTVAAKVVAIVSDRDTAWLKSCLARS